MVTGSTNSTSQPDAMLSTLIAAENSSEPTNWMSALCRRTWASPSRRSLRSLNKKTRTGACGGINSVLAVVDGSISDTVSAYMANASLPRVRKSGAEKDNRGHLSKVTVSRLLGAPETGGDWPTRRYWMLCFPQTIVSFSRLAVRGVTQRM